MLCEIIKYVAHSLFEAREPKVSRTDTPIQSNLNGFVKKSIGYLVS